MDVCMRALALCLLAAGCHGSSKPAAPLAAPSLTLQLSLAAPSSANGNLQIATAALHVRSLMAVSDRTADDPRARLGDLDVAMGDRLDQQLTAPPGLYSMVNMVLDGEAGIGIELAGAWSGAALHVQLASGPFDVPCRAPARLDPGQRITLALHTDPARWLAGVDLSQALSDQDDDGIVLSDDDNHALGALALANVLTSFQLECSSD
jgi:hypothetical protein